jgi:autotransporter-associated beta strand protein
LRCCAWPVIIKSLTNWGHAIHSHQSNARASFLNSVALAIFLRRVVVRHVSLSSSVHRSQDRGETINDKIDTILMRLRPIGCLTALLMFLCVAAPAMAQRVLGVDISYWNRGSSSGTTDGISQSAWNTAFTTPDQNGDTRKFVVIRASRGGTTGTNVSSGTPGNPSTPATLSQRYDDPDFARNITRAANAGFIAGAYHFGRPEVAGNTGADEANHFIEAAGAWMRPGYMMPMYDMESGSGSDALAQFTLDFSNRLYAVMGIRPSMYINGNYSSILQGASASLRNQLAQPVANSPSMVGPAYPMLWDARYSDNSSSAANYAIPVQTGSPKTTYTTISSYYGPWDDYGNTAPWGMWQYGSVQSIPGFNTVDSNVDGDVSHGDIEYVKDMMVPAVWWNNSSGDWGTMANWNSGQPIGNHANGDPAPTAPYTAPGQYPAMSGYVLPTPRLPGTAGSGPAITSGVNDTVILERQSANITVAISSGTYNIRKLYMRETLAITGGSLTINYDPLYNFNVGNADALRSGPISAQFSGPVSMSGSAALTVHTLQVDATRTFTVTGGTLTFNTINLMPNSATPAKLLLNGNVTINALNNGNPRNSLTATIANGSGTGSSGLVDLGGDTRTITVGDGPGSVDLLITVPITNGGLTKDGPGTMLVSGQNTFSGPVTVNGGVLRSGNSEAFNSNSVITVNNGATLDMNGFGDTFAALASAPGNTTGAVVQHSASLTLSAASGTNTFAGTITGTGSFTKMGGATEILSGNNSLGPVTVSAGTLLFNGINTTGNVLVTGGTLGGTGSVSGLVTVNSGGHLAPGASIESFGVGALNLVSGSVLDFEIGSGGAVDLASVTGQLQLNGGSVHIFDTGGMGPGTYPIILYGSRLGNVTNLGTPTGPAGFTYSLFDTGSSINLQVSLVPEASTLMLGAIGAWVLHFARHRGSRRS